MTARMFDNIGWVPPQQRIAAVLWISFLAAIVATGVFFSAIDPIVLRACVPFPEVSRYAAYSIGFLLFWLLTASVSLLAVFFLYPRRQDSAVTPSSNIN